MNLKKFKIINLIIVFILSFIAHNLYNIFPNLVTSIFFPVNESIFEHMKIFATCFIFYGILEYFLLKKWNIEFNNYIFSLLISVIVGIISYFIVFIPIYLFISRAMFIPILLMFLTYILMNLVSYYILKMKKIHNINTISTLLIILMYICFGYLTYNPPKNYLFLDTLEEKYGIDKFILK